MRKINRPVLVTTLLLAQQPHSLVQFGHELRAKIGVIVECLIGDELGDAELVFLVKVGLGEIQGAWEEV